MLPVGTRVRYGTSASDVVTSNQETAQDSANRVSGLPATTSLTSCWHRYVARASLPSTAAASARELSISSIERPFVSKATSQNAVAASAYQNAK